jgi:NAD(P)-dependent dehydrogenase (short-subunit alcohol dehydrogenase family)
VLATNVSHRSSRFHGFQDRDDGVFAEFALSHSGLLTSYSPGNLYFSMARFLGRVTIARDGAGVVIASQSGHRLPALTPEQNKALATAPADELLALPMLQPDQVTDPLHAYQLSKRGNSLRVMAEAVRWGKRGARVNTISPGIIITPLANDELKGPRGDGYRRMIELSAAGRAGTPDEVGAVGALLMGPDGTFITGSDFLMDGGVTAAYWYGELTPK